MIVALVVLVVALPPHVHPATWTIMLAAAALTGAAAALSFKWTPAGSLIGLFTLAALAANIALSYQPFQSARTLALLAALVLTGLASARLGSHEEARRRVIALIVLAGTLLALHGLYQSLFLFGPDAAAAAGGVPEAVRARIASGRAVSTMGLPGVLAGFLLLSLPLTAGWWSRGGKSRFAVLALLLVQTAGLLATRSAGAIISLALAAALVVRVRSRSGETEHRSGGRGLAAMLVVGGLVVASVLLAVRFTSPGSDDEGSGPFSLRGGNWKVAMKIFEENPFLGSGLGTYGIAFPAYREWGMNETRHAHNSYLQVFAEGGVSTGIPMLIALGLLISYAVRAAKGPGVWLAVATLAFLLHNLMDFTLFIEATGIGFACVAGLLVGLVLKPAGSEVTRSGPARLGLYALCFTLALFAFLVGRADALREEARDLVVARRWDEALEAGRAAVRRNPWDPAARSLLSHLYFDLSATGLPDALVNAEREGDAAARLDPHTPHHWSHLSHIRLTRGDIQGAYLAAARATELYPIEIRYREERDAIAGALQARHEDRP